MSKKIDRNKKLKSKLNKTLQMITKSPRKDFFSQLDIIQLAELKSHLSDINNTFTFRATVQLLKVLKGQFSTISAEIFNKELEKLYNTKSNSNGYDLTLSRPPIIGEVKCNIPINAGDRFGSAQENGIIKDLESTLRNQSATSQEN